MKKIYLILAIVVFSLCGYTFRAFTQVQNESKWTIKQIMQEDFTGHSPRNPVWSDDSKTLFFYWHTEDEKSDSLYLITTKNLTPQKAEDESSSRPDRGIFTRDKKLKLEQSSGGIRLVNLFKKDTIPVFNTTQRISGLKFSFDESQVLFTIDNNLYAWSINSGAFRQLTNFVKERPEKEKPKNEEKNEQDNWLESQQKELFPKLNKRGGRSSGYRGYGNYGRSSQGGPNPIYLDGYNVYGIELSPDNRYITYLLNKSADIRAKGTEMPVYVTATGYTEMRNTRSKVGSLPSEMKFTILNLEKDSVYELNINSLPGVFDNPKYYEEYDRPLVRDQPKAIYFSSPDWSADGKYGVFTASSYDNKDLWILKLDLEKGEAIVLDHQHDEAWIGGPGVGYRGGVNWMPDQEHIWFQSEETGYSHLYTINVATGEKKQLTSGHFEIYSPRFSKDKKSWYFYSNEVHPGERHFYKMDLSGGERIQLTTMPGNNSVTLSPNEKHMAIMYSFANRPAELYYQPAKPGAEAIQITDGRSQEFRSYDWRVPEFVTFEAEDGATVHARLYTPVKNKKNEAAVIFVHGAGYLQNAHKWWSTYYHEYLFHNILVDNGYTVLDIDYRGSAGYGRDWRTGIYRWMGGKDLSDQVDGAKWLVAEQGIKEDKIGIYGGSYGGFITLMALFNEPEVFTAGAALRSVTDWAHYNHGYTANILNTPVEDSLAYAKSSPIYFAEGLQGHLLMCHGMLDDNVHFQDIVRLSQRLIDLGKDNWELAVFPLERHSFSDPDAWTDEYKRIFKLFQQTIGKD